MNCVADENVDSQIVRQLRAAGHDVWYVAEQAPGIDDEDVLRHSTSRDALLLTGDRDFGDLVFRQGKASAGVLLIRLAGMAAMVKAQLVVQTVGDHSAELRGAFSVLTQKTLRIRGGGGRG